MPNHVIVNLLIIKCNQLTIANHLHDFYYFTSLNCFLDYLLVDGLLVLLYCLSLRENINFRPKFNYVSVKHQQAYCDYYL